jgi:hypothetical protein
MIKRGATQDARSAPRFPLKTVTLGVLFAPILYFTYVQAGVQPELALIANGLTLVVLVAVSYIAWRRAVKGKGPNDK